MTYEIRLVTYEDYQLLSPLLDPLIEKAHEYTPEYLPIDTIRDVRDENAFLFSIDNEEEFIAVAVIRLEVFPRKKYLNVQMVGGEGLEWASLLRDKMKTLGESLECDAITVYGRKGWAKVHEMDVSRYVLIQELGD